MLCTRLFKPTDLHNKPNEVDKRSVHQMINLNIQFPEMLYFSQVCVTVLKTQRVSIRAAQTEMHMYVPRDHVIARGKWQSRQLIADVTISSWTDWILQYRFAGKHFTEIRDWRRKERVYQQKDIKINHTLLQSCFLNRSMP